MNIPDPHHCTVLYRVPYCVKAVVWGGPLRRGGSTAGGGGRGARPWAGRPVGPPAHRPPLPPHGGHATGGRSSRHPRHTRPSSRRPGTLLLLSFLYSVVDPNPDRCRNLKAGWIRNLDTIVFLKVVIIRFYFVVKNGHIWTSLVTIFFLLFVFVQCSVADPGSGIRCFFDLWDLGWKKIRIRNLGWTSQIIFPRS